ncbi:MAG TPA: Fe-Mn family superoxide dismutase, partial [Usitatibacter sp.]
MRYQLKQIHCRPWTLSGLSLKLIESHYENNYGGALRRLNAITQQLESLDFATAPGYLVNSLKREELVALNSTLLHELYFASMGGEGKVTPAMSEALARDFGSVQKWRTEFSAMGYALGGGSGWVLLTWMPRDGRLINQYAAEHTQAVAGGVPILALDMFEHAYHIDFGANAKAYVDTFLRNVDWPAVEGRLEDATKVAPPRPVVQPEFDIPGVGVEEVRDMLAAGKPLQLIDT